MIVKTDKLRNALLLLIALRVQIHSDQTPSPIWPESNSRVSLVGLRASKEALHHPACSATIRRVESPELFDAWRSLLESGSGLDPLVAQ